MAPVEEEDLRVAALPPRGNTAGARTRLRFAFEAATLRQAVQLAAELRTVVRRAARIQPGLPRRPGPRPWTVTLTTPPVALDSTRRWEHDLGEVARNCPGCRLVGWSPVRD
jgi:hypothetical protein